MRITTSKSKNSESFYITQSYTNANGKSTSKTIRKLGTLAELSAQLHTDRDGVVEWANEQARLETLKYKSEKEDATVMIPFHSNRLMDYNKQKLFSGGYLFLLKAFVKGVRGYFSYYLRRFSLCFCLNNAFQSVLSSQTATMVKKHFDFIICFALLNHKNSIRFVFLRMVIWGG